MKLPKLDTQRYNSFGIYFCSCMWLGLFSTAAQCCSFECSMFVMPASQMERNPGVPSSKPATIMKNKEKKMHFDWPYCCSTFGTQRRNDRISSFGSTGCWRRVSLFQTSIKWQIWAKHVCPRKPFSDSTFDAHRSKISMDAAYSTRHDRNFGMKY